MRDLGSFASSPNSSNFVSVSVEKSVSSGALACIQKRHLVLLDARQRLGIAKRFMPQFVEAIDAADCTGAKLDRLQDRAQDQLGGQLDKLKDDVKDSKAGQTLNQFRSVLPPP